MSLFLNKLNEFQFYMSMDSYFQTLAVTFSDRD